MARKAKDIELLKLLFQRQMASSDAISQFANKWTAAPEPGGGVAGGGGVGLGGPTALSTSWLGEPEEEQPEPRVKAEAQAKPEPEKPKQTKPAEPLMSKQRAKPSVLPYGKKVGDLATYTSGKTFVEGMVSRGWTPEEAAGVAGNVHAESGFRPGIQEQKPIAGRGGYGLIQWTGPRRVAFERYARDTQRDPADPAAQMDWLHMERTGGSTKYGVDERASYKRAFAGGGTPEDIAERFGRFVERPADLSQSVATRRAMAARYARV